MIKSETRTKITSIDLMRILCAYMVVAIHVHPFEDVNECLGYIFTQVVPRIAVPFFFAVSGYFFIKSLIKDNSISFRYLKRLIVTYTLWSLIYFTYQLLENIVNGGISILSLIKSNIVSFLVFGSWYHLWYFPALIFCVVISSIFNKLRYLKGLAVTSILLYIIGLLGCSYYAIGIEIPIINQLYQFSQFTLIRRVVLMGLPFFMLGYFIHLINDKLDEIKNNTLIKLLILTIACFILEILLVILLNVQNNIIITLFLYPLVGVVLMLCLRNPMHNISCYANYFKYVANCTYYAHPLFMTAISIISNKIIGIRITQTPLFIIVCISTTVIASMIYKLNKKWLIKLIS